MDHEHHFRIHIGAAHIQIVGAYRREVLVNEQGLSVGGVIPVPLPYLSTGIQHPSLIAVIVGRGHKIVPYSHGVDLNGEGHPAPSHP